MPRAHVRQPAFRRRTTGLLFAALAVAMGTACGSSPEPPPRPEADAAPIDERPSGESLLTGVIDRIEQHGSARSEMRGHLGLVGELTASGVVEYQPGHAEIDMNGHTRPSKSQPRQDVEFTVVDETGYLKSPLMKPEPDKPWLAIAPNKADFAAQLLSPALRQLRQSADPRTTFNGVEAATRIEGSAPDAVDGRPATRYELRLITEQGARTAPDEQQRTRFQQAADAGVAELSYQLWIDENGLPARFSTAQEVAQAGNVALSSTYHHWGVPVDIEPPPPELIGVFRDIPAPQAQPPR